MMSEHCEHDGCRSNSCASQINEKHRGICPEGWHIPSNEDWDILMEYVQTDNGATYTGTNGIGAVTVAGKYLKATSGWKNDCDDERGNSEDKYGFAALPGGNGFGYSGGNFEKASLGYYGFWWSSTESTHDFGKSADCMGMGACVESVNRCAGFKYQLSSVRCVKD